VYIYTAPVTGNVEPSEPLEVLDSQLELSFWIITQFLHMWIRSVAAEISKLFEIFLAIQTAT